MVVPFGFGVGKSNVGRPWPTYPLLICLGMQVTSLQSQGLIYKIGLELKKNPDSGPDYRHLLVEPESLDRALKQLQCIRPAHHKLRRLEGIRALASTCQRPLKEFLAKIEKLEEHLGPWGAKCNRLPGFGRRLQWSTKYKEYVKELRAKLARNYILLRLGSFGCNEW